MFKLIIKTCVPNKRYVRSKAESVQNIVYEYTESQMEADRANCVCSFLRDGEILDSELYTIEKLFTEEG